MYSTHSLDWQQSHSSVFSSFLLLLSLAELQVTSAELQVTSAELQVTSANLTAGYGTKEQHQEEVQEDCSCSRSSEASKPPLSDFQFKSSEWIALDP